MTAEGKQQRAKENGIPVCVCVFARLDLPAVLYSSETGQSSDTTAQLAAPLTQYLPSKPPRTGERQVCWRLEGLTQYFEHPFNHYLLFC